MPIVTVSLDDALLAHARAEPADLSTVMAAALRQYLDRGLDRSAADRRWAEDNALAVEALAGGAEEAK
jgi:post-segregation antitoxin (ccd killing protein)